MFNRVFISDPVLLYLSIFLIAFLIAFLIYNFDEN